MPKVEERIVITSGADLQRHFDSILPALQLIESEDSWQKIEKSLLKLEVITKSGGYKHDSFTALFKSVAQPVINSLLSERTKLSGTAADLLNSVAPRLGERFEALIHVFAPTLLLICARTNKVALVRAKKCLLLIAKHCKLPSLLTHLRDASRDKSQTMRIVSVEVTLMLLEAVESKEKIGKRVADIESIIKGTATDRDPEVRQWCKRVFEVYIDWWPERVTLFTSSFTPTTRRYLALPKASLSAPAKTAPQKTLITPFKRLETTLSTQASNTAGPSIKTHQPSSYTHASTSHAINTTTTAPPHQSSHTSRQQSTRTERTPSSSSASSSRGTQPVISVTEVKQQVTHPPLESEDDKKRAALRAEILKQATGTPSQSIAARLALQQLDFQLKKSKKANDLIPPEGGQQEDVIRRQTDRALFNIAMAKKKQSPKKGPSRIVVAAPPPSTSQKPLPTSSKPAQRIASTDSSRSTSSSSAKGKKAEMEEEEPDVFRSRPIPTKMTSSISRGLSAREKLLKTSALKATSSPLANRGLKNARGGVNRKIIASKVDIGKENIPPGSGLASIVQSEFTEEPRGRIPPSVLIASTVAAVEASKLSKPVEEVKPEAVEFESGAEEEVLIESMHKEEELLAVEVSSSAPEVPYKVEEQSLLPPQAEEGEAIEVIKATSVSSTAGDFMSSIGEQDTPPQKSAPLDEGSPLDEWKAVASSLPSEEPKQYQDDAKPSSDSGSTEVVSSPPQKVIIGPFMSTSARGTLGEIHQNLISPLSLSSPLCKKTKHQSKSPVVKIASTLASVTSLKVASQTETAPDENTQKSVALQQQKRRLILAVSRKM